MGAGKWGVVHHLMQICQERIGQCNSKKRRVNDGVSDGWGHEKLLQNSTVPLIEDMVAGVGGKEI